MDSIIVRKKLFCFKDNYPFQSQRTDICEIGMITNILYNIYKLQNSDSVTNIRQISKLYKKYSEHQRICKIRFSELPKIKTIRH